MWASVAPSWGEYAEYADARGTAITERMLSLSAPRPGQRVLELACGAGGLGLAAAGLVAPTGEAVLSDVAPEMLAEADARIAARGIANATTLRLDLEQIDQPDAAYDVVVSREGLMFALDPRFGFRKRWESLIFTRLALRAKRKLRAAGIAFPSVLFGLHQSGEITESYLLRLIPRLASGVTEIYCHPAFLPCLEIQRWTPTYHRDVELDVLTRWSIRHAVEEGEVKLISYRDLPRVLHPSVPY